MADSGGVDGEPEGNRRTRWRGLAGVSLVRLWKRTVRTGSSRVAATVGAVALTIALLVVVTGVTLALADGGAVDDADADVRIVPEESGTLSAVDGVEGPRLGETTERAESIRSANGVDHASPVLVEPVALEPTDGGDPQRVLLVGVVPDDEPRTVGGLSTEHLEPSDSHVEDGSDGFGRGEIVLSSSAADRLEAETDDEVTVAASSLPGDASEPSMTTTAVEGDGDETPIALVHLRDLQALSGADDGQLADRVLVWGETDAATTAASDAYPDAAIESDGRADPSSLFGDGLAFATSVLALVIGVAICASFVATTAGMTVTEDRRTLAVLEAVGVPARSRLAIVAVSTLVTTLCGALLGVVLGVAGIYVVNAVAGATVAPGAVAQVHPVFVPYALVVALLSGLVAVPYPLAVATRTSFLEEVGR